jgi:NIMA (never in mitosis gene a)-related kinase
MGILKTQTGTPYYASPEVWQDKPYDKRSDLWSLGCVLYELVALSPPFTAPDIKSLYSKVLKGSYPRIPPSFSSDISLMIKTLLQVDPKNRPSTTQILHMPILVARHNEQPEACDDEIDLLGTIRVPRNMKLLADMLPKSKYGQESLYSKKGENSTASSDDS